MRRWWVVAAVVLLLIAAACFTMALRGHSNPLVVPASAPQFAPSSAPPSVAGGTAPKPSEVVSPGLARSVPVELRIPAIDVAVSVSALGLNPDRTVQVPTDFEEPGWFRLGPSPGQVGSAVILGHVDSHQGPAVFFLLRFLRAGDRVTVRLANGVITHFVVSAVATYPNEQFPARKVYGSHGYSALQLVTCGGEFDTQTDSYMSNVVVYTTLVSTTRAAPRVPAATGPAGNN